MTPAAVPSGRIMASAAAHSLRGNVGGKPGSCSDRKPRSALDAKVSFLDVINEKLLGSINSAQHIVVSGPKPFPKNNQ